MNYAKARMRLEAMSVVYWHGHHWHIQGLNRLKQTANLLSADGNGMFSKNDVPLKEIRE